ncbi:MAG: alkaline phosphatase family protein [Eubacterium sp.]|nr:alkaline phosphatase family protein [Eubacterium sp.]
MKQAGLHYEKCLTGLANSILKRFGVPPVGPTLPPADTLLEKHHRNTVVFLLDGMGKSVLEENLEEDGLLRSHLVDTYYSVFPPTTVAATTSLLTGLDPCGYSWLGWDCYYPDIDKNVTVYLNTIQGTKEPAADYPVAEMICPYKSIIESINEAGGMAYGVSPYMDLYMKGSGPSRQPSNLSDPSNQDVARPKTWKQIIDRVHELCELPGEKFIYAYWEEPDHTMHNSGCFSKSTRRVLRRIENRLEELAEQLTDTQIIITADHGHINSRGVALESYPQLSDCLVRMPSIEPRALNLFVKPGREKEFEHLFEEAFGEEYILMSREEVLNQNLFGKSEEHEQFCRMLGDYIGIAVSDLTIYRTEKDAAKHIGVHAGLTEDEMVIPLISIECD